MLGHYARADGASADVLERLPDNRRGEIIDVYTSFEWRTLRESVKSLGKLYDFRPKIVDAVGMNHTHRHTTVV